MKAKSILLLLMLAVATGASAAMYKWTDAQGQVHYSQDPPAQGNAKEIAPPPRVEPPASSSSAAKTANDNAEGKSAEQEANQMTPEEQEAYRRNCEAARANLEIYRTKGRIRTPDGDVVNLEDDVRQKKIQQAEEQIKKFCK